MHVFCIANTNFVEDRQQYTFLISYAEHYLALCIYTSTVKGIVMKCGYS